MAIPAAQLMVLASILFLSDPAPPTDEVFEKTLEAVRTELGNGFQIAREGVFVVAGDLDAERFLAMKEGTIRGCSMALYQDYFDTRPSYPIVVYLFKTAQRYAAFARQKHGGDPGTPYGYYSPSDKTLVMNISTGSGTLAHEMTHALVDVDFPSIPAWFNEGLGSLHEQSSHRDGSLVGLPNWRLPRFHEALEDSTCLTVEQLVSLTDSEFYGPDSDLHYSQARYLCMYLQQLGLLVPLYRGFRQNHDSDPTGLATLKSLLNGSLSSLQKDWFEWVSRLSWE